MLIMRRKKMEFKFTTEEMRLPLDILQKAIKQMKGIQGFLDNQIILERN